CIARIGKYAELRRMIDIEFPIQVLKAEHAEKIRREHRNAPVRMYANDPVNRLIHWAFHVLGILSDKDAAIRRADHGCRMPDFGGLGHEAHLPIRCTRRLAGIWSGIRQSRWFLWRCVPPGEECDQSSACEYQPTNSPASEPRFY